MHQLFAFLLALSYCTVLAQSQETAWILGGTAGFNRSVNEQVYVLPGAKTQVSNFEFYAYGGKQVNDRWLVGLQSGYSLQQSRLDGLEDGRTEKTKVQVGEFGVFARYRLNQQGALGFYLEPAIYTLVSSSRDFVRDVETVQLDAFGGGLRISPVLTCPLAPSWQLLARFPVLGYELGQWQREGNEVKKTYSRFSSAVNLLSLQLGVEVRL